MPSGGERSTTTIPRSFRTIEPARGWLPVRPRELWRARELLAFLTWRDIKVRYTQTALGIAWAVLQPLVMMAIFTIFLGRLVRVPSEGVPYSVFALSGLVLWLFFANGVVHATESLVSNSELVSKVYFPRLVVPLASLLAWVPDLILSFLMLIGLAAVLGAGPAPTVVFAPLFALLAFFAAAGVSVWLSGLNVTYRDVRYAVPFLIQIGLFATPVLYPSSLLPERFRVLLGLNPMTGAVEGFRWSVLGSAPPNWALLATSAVMAVGVFVAGLFWFRRVEHGFADVV